MCAELLEGPGWLAESCSAEPVAGMLGEWAMVTSIWQPANRRNPDEVKATPLRASLGRRRKPVLFNRKAGISMGWVTI